MCNNTTVTLQLKASNYGCQLPVWHTLQPEAVMQHHHGSNSMPIIKSCWDSESAQHRVCATQYHQSAVLVTTNCQPAVGYSRQQATAMQYQQHCCWAFACPTSDQGPQGLSQVATQQAPVTAVKVWVPSLQGSATLRFCLWFLCQCIPHWSPSRSRGSTCGCRPLCSSGENRCRCPSQCGYQSKSPSGSWQ